MQNLLEKQNLESQVQSLNEEIENLKISLDKAEKTPIAEGEEGEIIEQMQEEINDLNSKLMEVGQEVEEKAFKVEELEGKQR